MKINVILMSAMTSAVEKLMRVLIIYRYRCQQSSKVSHYSSIVQTTLVYGCSFIHFIFENQTNIIALKMYPQPFTEQKLLKCACHMFERCPLLWLKSKDMPRHKLAFQVKPLTVPLTECMCATACICWKRLTHSGAAGHLLKALASV